MEKNLSHSGVKEQRWGIRRYQNPDGTYTELGKQRRRKGFQNSNTRSSGSRASKKLKEARRKDINEMTDAELKEYNNRLQLERQYADLTKGSISDAKQFANNTAKAVVSGIITGIAIEAGKKFIKDNMSDPTWLAKIASKLSGY